MEKFIITSEPKEALNFKKESLGVEDKRALFFSPPVGRHRIYRSSISSPQKGLKLLQYKTKKYAEKICQMVNEVYNDNFKVEALN